MERSNIKRFKTEVMQAAFIGVQTYIERMVPNLPSELRIETKMVDNVVQVFCRSPGGPVAFEITMKEKW